MNYKVGDTITYESYSGGRRTGVVVGKYDDVKNGRPGFDLSNADGEWWGYDYQITAVRPA